MVIFSLSPFSVNELLETDIHPRDHEYSDITFLSECCLKSLLLRSPASIPILRGDPSSMQLRLQDSTVWDSWMKPLLVSCSWFKVPFHLQHTNFPLLNDTYCFSTQLLWHMGSTSRIFQLLRKSQRRWCLWILAIQATRSLCVPLIKASSRCVPMTFIPSKCGHE